jgi:hypothetical protein
VAACSQTAAIVSAWIAVARTKLKIRTLAREICAA